jgi:integrase/recombinase XerC
VAIFLIMRFTGLRRGSVAALRVRNLEWGLRGVRVKGREDPGPPAPVRLEPLSCRLRRARTRPGMRGRDARHTNLLVELGRRTIGKMRAPMVGKNIWRLCKVYGRLIGYPELKPHDLRHGVAVEVLKQRHDLEEVRALLGHARIDTTQIYTKIRPPQLKRAVAQRMLGA